MLKIICSMLALAGMAVLSSLHAAPYADALVAYNPGSLPASVSNYTNATAALGEPSRITPGAYGGPVDPFDPPYLSSQLVSVGTNGSLTVQFSQPIHHDPAHPYGLDFIIFGSTGLMITNGDYSGGGITDGTLFGNSEGATRVLVSADNTTYYPLDPSFAPTVDGFFPTDGQGDFTKPVNPALATTDFAGKGLAGIRQLYAGSGGGTGYDIRWARDNQGQPANLQEVRYVRVEVLSGHSEIGGFAAVIPLPSIKADFSTDPASQGWQALGNTNLFHWNPTNQNLEVTWDSSKPNSYFLHPLGWTLNKNDNFSLEFDLEMQSIQAGVTPGKSFAFELAMGFLNQTAASQPSFQRGTATSSPNLVEFDYFPDTGYGATISPVIVSSNSQFNPSFSFPLELTLGAKFHVALQYTAYNRTLATSMTRDGLPFGPINDVKLGTNFSDFHVDAVTISSFSDAGADGSLLARGTVDNILVLLPFPPVINLEGHFNQGTWEVELLSQAGWSYTLERTSDFSGWSKILPSAAGTGSRLTIQDTNTPAEKVFYRVIAERP